MAIRSISDVVAAYDAGRYHSQRFIKTSGSQVGDSQWHDWAYASGQPAFDARIGTAGAFNPVVAQRNDAIWFPDVPAGMDRHLVSVSVRRSVSGNDQVQCDMVLYDLLGVYPLIDGDSLDPQEFDNTLTLPRYIDGRGVRAVLVNHVAPQVTSGGTHLINYTDASGVNRDGTFGIHNWGVNRAVTRAVGASSNDLFMALPGDGVRRINSIQYTEAPGGLQCIYLVKPLCTVPDRTGRAGVNETAFSVKDLMAFDGFRMPQIYDGAHLGFFFMPVGGSRAVSTIFGECKFIWG